MFMVIGVFVNAQNMDLKIYKKNLANPILIINDAVLGSPELLLEISKEEIKKISILKDEELSLINIFPIDKLTNGIIYASLEVEFEAKTQEELNLFFGLKSDNNIYINGYLIENKEFSIATKSIKKIELIEADGLISKVAKLNISL